MVLGENIKGNGILSLIPGSESGFLPSEGNFLVQLMKSVGVESFFFSAVGGEVKSTNEKFYLLDDGFDFTSISTCVSPAGPFLSDCPVFNNSECILDSMKCNSGSYFQYTGPFYPTEAEQEFAKQVNASFIGITNL